MYISTLVISVSQLDYCSSVQASLSCSSLLYNLYCQIFLTLSSHIISLLRILYRCPVNHCSQAEPHTQSLSLLSIILLTVPQVYFSSSTPVFIASLVHAIPLFPLLRLSKSHWTFQSHWTFFFEHFSSIKLTQNPASSLSTSTREAGKVQCLFSEPSLELGDTRWHSCSQWVVPFSFLPWKWAEVPRTAATIMGS